MAHVVAVLGGLALVALGVAHTVRPEFFARKNQNMTRMVYRGEFGKSMAEAKSPFNMVAIGVGMVFIGVGVLVAALASLS